MEILDKISFPNPNRINDNELGAILVATFKKYATHKVRLLYVVNHGLHEIFLIDDHYNDFIKIIVQSRIISLQLTTKKTANLNTEEVKEIYEVVYNLFEIWFVL